jgi:hypothetical protein
MSDQNVVYGTNVRQPDFRKRDDVVEIAKVVQGYVFQDTRYAFYAASFFKTKRTDSIEIAVVCHRANSKGIVKQSALLATSMVCGWAPMPPTDTLCLFGFVVNKVAKNLRWTIPYVFCHFVSP